MKTRTPKLGQHFLTGTWAAHALANAVDVREGETILEIGPGKGALTKELLMTGAPVVAIEKDELLVAQLRETFKDEISSGQLTLVSDDIRNVTALTLGISEYVVAANIPYYITGEIIRMFLESEMQPRALALLIQKEVADRILARDKKESILSISVKAYGVPTIAAKVTRGNFSPPPSVDSAILLIDRVSKVFFEGIRESDFFAVVKAGFSSKRKFLANNIATRYDKVAVMKALGSASVAEKARAEDLELLQWRELTRALTTIDRA